MLYNIIIMTTFYFMFLFILLFLSSFIFFFFFNDTATTEIYTLSLHDALPILVVKKLVNITPSFASRSILGVRANGCPVQDRKSTRLSSHVEISYAVFCLKKKKKKKNIKHKQQTKYSILNNTIISALSTIYQI